MSAQTQLSLTVAKATAAPTDATSSLRSAFPTFGRLLPAGGPQSLWIWKTMREHPALSALAIAMLSIFVYCKGMTLWATYDEALVEGWIRYRGGYCQRMGDSAHMVLAVQSEIFGRNPMDGRLISVASVPARVVNNEEEQLFAKLSKLSRLRSLFISADENTTGGVAKPFPVGVAPAEANIATIIDSEKLQRGLASLPRSVSLYITQCGLTHCEKPLDLSHRVSSISLQNAVITREFVHGLPIVNRCGYLIVNGSRIDDAAVEILLERISTDYVGFYSTSMTAKTLERVSKIKGVTVVSPNVIASESESP